MNFNVKNNYLLYFTTLGIWVITVLIKIKYNGLIFGFDYGLYHPDGALYATRALNWSGYTETEAAKIVSEWYNIHAFKLKNTNPSDFFYSTNHIYADYAPRVLYPLLSIPFIKLICVPGMLVVPALSLLVVMIMITKIGIELNKIFATFLTLIAISSSSTVLRWMLANTTDSLLVGLFSVAAFYLSKKTPILNLYLPFGVLIVLTGLTRLSILFWFAISVVYLVKREVKLSVFILAFSTIAVIPTLFNNSNSSFLTVESQRNILQRLLLYPFYVLKITFYESAQLFVLDRVLFLMCLLSLYYSIRYFYKDSSKFFILVLTAGILTGALNGTVGVNFRYQLPVVVFICWSIIDNLEITYNKFFRKV
jgi:hypothetical protein